jgi:hypothetical protein
MSQPSVPVRAQAQSGTWSQTSAAQWSSAGNQWNSAGGPSASQPAPINQWAPGNQWPSGNQWTGAQPLLTANGQAGAQPLHTANGQTGAQPLHTANGQTGAQPLHTASPAGAQPGAAPPIGGGQIALTTVDQFAASVRAPAGSFVCLTGMVQRQPAIGIPFPGNFLLVNPLLNRPIAALSSDQVNLAALVGQTVTVCGISLGEVEGVLSLRVTSTPSLTQPTGQNTLQQLLLALLFSNPFLLLQLLGALQSPLFGLSGLGGAGTGLNLGLTGQAIGISGTGTQFGSQLGSQFGTQLGSQFGTQIGTQGSVAGIAHPLGVTQPGGM